MVAFVPFVSRSRCFLSLWRMRERYGSISSSIRRSTEKCLLPGSIPPFHFNREYPWCSDQFRQYSQAISSEMEGVSQSQDNNEAQKEREGANHGSIEYVTNSKLKPNPRHDMAMIFTCKVCETRSVKTVCRDSYEKGIVVVRCSGCNNLHLIADNLGWFGDPGNVEQFLAARGEQVQKGAIDTLNLTAEDLIGMKPPS